MKKMLFAAVISLSLTACASWWGDTEYDKLSAQVNSEIELAKKTGFLWTNTEGFVKKAEAAKGDGKMDEAVKLLKKALFEAQQAQVQAKEQANARAPF